MKESASPFVYWRGQVHCIDCRATVTLDGPHVLLIHADRCALVADLEDLASAGKPLFFALRGGPMHEIHSARRGAIQ